MAKSTSPHNGSGVFSTLQELTAEFVLDDESQPKWGDGRVIDEPSLPCPGSISGPPAILSPAEQDYLASNRLAGFNREIKAALDLVMKECGRT